MNSQYKDSLVPLSIGTSFFLILIAFLAAGAIAGLFLDNEEELQQLGGIPLLIIFLVLVVGPLFYNKNISRFEKDREIQHKIDCIGTIQGLRGAFLRCLIYEDGIEIRAFYHRYFIPYSQIQKLSISENKFSTILNFPSGIDGIPDTIVSSGIKFQSLSRIIQKKIEPGATLS